VREQDRCPPCCVVERPPKRPVALTAVFSAVRVHARPSGHESRAHRLSAEVQRRADRRVVRRWPNHGTSSPHSVPRTFGRRMPERWKTSLRPRRRRRPEVLDKSRRDHCSAKRYRPSTHRARRTIGLEYMKLTYSVGPDRVRRCERRHHCGTASEEEAHVRPFGSPWSRLRHRARPVEGASFSCRDDDPRSARLSYATVELLRVGGPKTVPLQYGPPSRSRGAR